MSQYKKPTLLPKDFVDILSRRYLPALSFTYVVSVLALASRQGNFLHYFLHDKTAYLMALAIAVWISIPALLWIFIKSIRFSAHAADDWYKITCGLMLLFLFVSFALFPEGDLWGLKIYFAATIPIFLAMYVLLVKDGLPAWAAHPMIVLGLTFLIYGAFINLTH